jgi:hypothetical protein
MPHHITIAGENGSLSTLVLYKMSLKGRVGMLGIDHSAWTIQKRRAGSRRGRFWQAAARCDLRASAGSAHGLFQKRYYFRPNPGCEGGIQRPQRTVRRHEGVACTGVDGQRHVLARTAQFGFERMGSARREKAIVLRHVPADGPRQLRPVRLHFALRKSVKGHDRLDLVGTIGGDDKREHSTHAESHHADAVD